MEGDDGGCGGEGRGGMQTLIDGRKPTKQMRACVKLVEWVGVVGKVVSKRWLDGEEK